MIRHGAPCDVSNCATVGAWIECVDMCRITAHFRRSRTLDKSSTSLQRTYGETRQRSIPDERSADCVAATALPGTRRR